MDYELFQYIHGHHSAGKSSSSAELENSDSIQIMRFGWNTIHSVPAGFDVTLFVKEILKLPYFTNPEPVFIYTRNGIKYQIVSRLAKRETDEIIQLIEDGQLDAAATMLISENEVLTDELVESIQKSKLHLNSDVGRMLETLNPKKFRFEMFPPYCSELYYDFNFMTIKNEEDEFRRDVKSKPYYHGLEKIDVYYGAEGKAQTPYLIPMLSFNAALTPSYSPDQIKSSIDEMIDAILSTFPTIPPNQLVIAGGAISSLYHDKFKSRYQDIDVFVIGDIDIDALATHFYGKELVFNENIIATRIKITSLSEDHDVSVQLVKRRYNSLAEILHGFDIDGSCIGVECHTRQVYVTKRFDYAFNSDRNTVDLDRLSPSYEARLAKYSRRGWNIFIPGVTAIDHGFSITDDRQADFRTLVLDITKHIDRYGYTTLSNYWTVMSGLTRIAFMKAISDKSGFEGITFKFTSDYIKTPLMENLQDPSELAVFRHWKTENPGAQHTSSFQPLPNDKSWYAPNFESIIESFKIIDKLRAEFPTLRATDENLEPKMYRLYERRDGVYVGTKIASSSDIKKPTKYFYMYHTHDLQGFAPTLLSMTVFDSETQQIVGTLSGSHFGSIVPEVYYSASQPKAIAPNVKAIRTTLRAISNYIENLKQDVGLGGHLDDFTEMVEKARLETQDVKDFFQQLKN